MRPKKSCSHSSIFSLYFVFLRNTAANASEKKTKSATVMPGMSPKRGRLEFLLANDDHGCYCWKAYGCSGDFVLEKRREEKFASQEECSSDGLCWSDGGVFLIWEGDVLSGTSSNGMHHAGILEEWFGFHWWNERVPILVLTIVLILAPLVSFKRVGDVLSGTSSNGMHHAGILEEWFGFHLVEWTCSEPKSTLLILTSIF